jgi:hypothetical protein
MFEQSEHCRSFANPVTASNFPTPVPPVAQIDKDMVKMAMAGLNGRDPDPGWRGAIFMAKGIA